MNLGEKIKKIRKKRKLTQNALAGDKVTRNMISRIESGDANPSLDTLLYIADKLNVPLPYLMSEEDELFIYEKNKRISKIISAFRDNDYKLCISLINEISDVDDELAYILSICYFELGKKNVISGALNSALDCFSHFKESSTKTVYSLNHITPQLLVYEALALNIKSPLLEFDSKLFENSFKKSFDYEFYKYLLQDLEYTYTDSLLKSHIAAKLLIKERRYIDAINKLNIISEYMISKAYNSYVIYSVYYDLEMCYKEIRDFENAYKYSNKRLTLIESFKS